MTLDNFLEYDPGMITFYYNISSANFLKTPLWFKPNISSKLVLLDVANEGCGQLLIISSAVN